jgi:hypothetical protein
MVRRRCETRLRELQLPVTVMRMTDVAAYLSDRRGRPIHLHALAFPSGGPTGAWIATRSIDHIFYESNTSPRHQDQILGHELGHLTSGHESSPVAALAPLLLAPAAASVILARQAYLDEQEVEAEQMADLLVTFVERSSRQPATVTALEQALRHNPHR